MANKSGIEWTDASWNPTTGCRKVSAGCKHCYAERDWGRFAHLPAFAGRAFTDVACHPDRLDQPLRWKRPRKIFVNMMSDLFCEEVPDVFIDQVFAVMALAKQHTFQVLTKRPERMLRYMERLGRSAKLLDGGARALGYTLEFNGIYFVDWPLPNVWMGVSVEDQDTADERIPLLLRIQAAVRWISAEPLLGPIDLTRIGQTKPYVIDALRGTMRPTVPISLDPSPVEELNTVQWCVTGGESGGRLARPMHPQWARNLRDQCHAAGVPFHFKQWGAWYPEQPVAGGDLGGDLRRGVVQHVCADRENDGHFRRGDAYMRRLGKKSAGRLLDGALHDNYPQVVL